MSNYWHTPPQFNPGHQYQALLNFLAHLQTHPLFQQQQPSWHAPGLVSPQTYMQGLTPTVSPPKFLPSSVQFTPPPVHPMPGPAFHGGPLRLGPNPGGAQ